MVAEHTDTCGRRYGSSTEVSPHPPRFGVIDIGSNSVRLVVFDGATRSPAYFFNEKVYCGLGSDIERTGALSPEGKTRALATLRRFVFLARRLEAAPIEAVATAAMRDATDGPAFAERIADETGLTVRIISGEEEGHYAGLGVLLGEPRARGVVADIGGASLELARVADEKVEMPVSTPLGPMRLKAAGLKGEKLEKHVARVVRDAWPEPTGEPLYLVGGGWRAFASLDIARAKHPLHMLQGYAFPARQALETAAWILGSDEDELRDAGLSDTRAENAPWTAVVMRALVKHLKPEQLIVSACGLREGLLYSNLPDALHQADPLTQSARIMETVGARFPGFGDRLADWLAPVLPEIPERLRLAAALLADVNWRIHPDYRAEACFTTVTQSSLAGLSHPERVMLAVALAFRYKSARSVVDAQRESQLLDDDQRAKAESLGRVIRLGAMLSSATPGILPECPLMRDDDTLTLRIAPEFAALESEIVEKRLRAAANSLVLEPRLLRGSE